MLAGCQLFLRRIIERWTMPTNGASVVEDRAGITFGVEQYVPWDAPEAVVDIIFHRLVSYRCDTFRMSFDWLVVERAQRKVVCYRAETLAVCECWSQIVVA